MFSEEDLCKLNERFIKDYKVNIDKGISYYPEIFIERLKQFEYYKPEIYNKYETFIKEIEENFNNVDMYYNYRNQLADKIITDLLEKQKKYNFIGNDGMKEIKNKFPLKNLGIATKGYLKENLQNMELLSIDLKSANFTSLKEFNNEIINNKTNYDDFISDYTDFIHIKESKYFRQRIFGKANVSQQIYIEKSLTESIAEKLLQIIKKEDFISLTNDEIILKNYKNKLKEILEILANTNLKLHIEEFSLKKIKGSKEGFLKEGIDILENQKIFKIYGLSTLIFPFVLEYLYNLPHKNSYEYFVNQEGFLSKFIDIPKIYL